MSIERIIELATHPAAVASSIASTIGALLVVPPDVLLLTVWQSIGTLFGAASIAGFTLGGRIDWLPAEALQTLAIVLGVLLIVKRLASVYDRLQTNSDQS